MWMVGSKLIIDWCETNNEKYFESKMPYTIVRVGAREYSVINAITGRVHSYGTTLAAAKAQMRLLYGVEHGWKPSRSRSRATTFDIARYEMLNR
jgi:hypothetical protein